MCVRALNCASRLALRLIWSCVSRLSNPGVCQSSQLCKPPRSPPHLVLCLTALKSSVCVLSASSGPVSHGSQIQVCQSSQLCKPASLSASFWSCVSRLSNPGVCHELSTVQACLALRLIWSCVSRLSNPGVCHELSTVQAASLSASSGPVSHGSQIQVCVTSSQLCKPPRSPPHPGPVSHGSQIQVCVSELSTVQACPRSPPHPVSLSRSQIQVCVSSQLCPRSPLALTALKSRCVSELSTVQAASLSASSGPVSHGSQIQVCVRALNCASRLALRLIWSCVSRLSNPGVCQSSQLCKPPRSPPHLVLCLTALKSRCVSELSTVQAASLSASSGPVSHGSQIQVITTEGSTGSYLEDPPAVARTLSAPATSQAVRRARVQSPIHLGHPEGPPLTPQLTCHFDHANKSLRGSPHWNARHHQHQPETSP